MSVRIRLRRMGTRKKAFYRIVVADQRTSRDGRFIELLGTCDPKADPPAITLNAEKAQGWLAKGAQPSDVVRSILVREGILERPGGVVYAPKPKAKEAVAEQPAPEAAAEAPAEAAPEAAPEAPAEAAPEAAAEVPAEAATDSNDAPSESTETKAEAGE